MTRSKYGAVPTERDGYRFASRREAADYDALALRLKAGEIRDLQLQVRFPCVVEGYKVCDYVADFVYYERVDDVTWRFVIQDSKGVRTPIYRLKAKLIRAIYGVEIRET